MHALILLLSLVAPPPDLLLSLPIGTTRSEDGGLYAFGGSQIGAGAGGWSGNGWRFANGSSVDVASNGATYRHAAWETDVYRLSIFAGTDFGARQEWYLVHGLVATSDLGWGTSTAGVMWYPMEFVSISFGLDPLRGRLGWGWSLRF